MEETIFELTWRNKWLTSEAKDVKEMVACLRAAADELEQMAKDGLVLENGGELQDDYAFFVTTDSQLAEKYGMHERDFE